VNGRNSTASRSRVVAVVGPGEEATQDAIDDAEATGAEIAERGWITLTGGRDAGVMAAAARGSAGRGGVSLGLLPGASRADAAPELTIALATGLGESRNALIATGADAVVACGMNPGTASEVALALRARKPIVLVRPAAGVEEFFRALTSDGATFVHAAPSPAAALAWLEAHLDR
jgi:uncharacterized protein (TIGR00725 family)